MNQGTLIATLLIGSLWFYIIALMVDNIVERTAP